MGGDSVSEQRSRPRSRILRVRVSAVCVSGLSSPSIFSREYWKAPVDLESPPPRCRQAPVSMGRQAMVLNIMAPLR